MTMVEPIYNAGILPDDYTVDINEVYPLIEKVARQTIASTEISDRLALFNKAPIANGKTIEEYVVEIATSTAYNISSTNPFSIKNPSIKTVYYKDWTHKQFDVTVYDNEIRKVLLADGNAGRVSAEIVASLTKGDIYEKYLAVRDMFSYMFSQDLIKKSDEILKTNYKGILKELKDTVDGMTFPNADFNVAGIIRETPKSRIRILMPYKIKNAIDVEELAGVFNLSKAEVQDRIITIDYGNTIYVVDELGVLVYTRLYQMGSMPYNIDNLSKKFVLHTDRLYALSPLFDMYAINVVDELTNAGGSENVGG